MKHQLRVAAVAAATLTLAACGGGGNDQPSATTAASRVYVSGVLDAAQSPISNLVFKPLADATAGTPLNGVVVCGNQIVTYDTLDIVDAVASGLQMAAATQNPAAIANVAPQIQTQVTQLAADLQTLLGALAGGASCSSMAAGSGSMGSNPLAGTPLAPLGNALAPVLAQIQAGSSGNSGRDVQLTTLATTVNLLATALNSGLAQVPAQAKTAPIVGGVLTTVGSSLADVSRLLNVALAYQGAQTQAALETTLNHTLSNLLTQVVPVAFLETQAGRPGVFSNQINAAIASASHQLATGLGTVTTPVLETGLRDALAPALNPIENQILPAILGPINSVIGSSGSGSSAATGLPPQLAGAVQPLTSLLGTLSGVLKVPAGGACPLAGVLLLSVACGLMPH